MNLVEEFCKKYDFPSDATKSLTIAYNKLMSCQNARQVYNEQIEDYKLNIRFDAHKLFDSMRNLESETGINDLTLCTLLLIGMWPEMYKVYKNSGFPEKMVDETMIGLKSGVIECFNLKGVWGNTAPEWLSDFYYLNRFTFGRLQYNFAEFKENGIVEGYSFKKGDPYLEVHIPSIGPLDIQACHKSYKECAEFFKNKFDGPVIFGCDSYLLYPENNKILKPTSNILKFAQEYMIIKSGEDPTNHNYWRIFGSEKIPEDLNTVECKTSMQKGYLKWLKSGGTIGWGFGIIVFDFKKF